VNQRLRTWEIFSSTLGIQEGISGCDRIPCSLKNFKMNPPLIIGLVAVAIAIWHEVSWLKRRDWSRLSGTVVDIHKMTKRNRTWYCPVISYTGKNGEKQFISKYGGNVNPKIGETVTVIVSPNGDSEEHYSTSNRWLISVIALCIGILLTIKGCIDLQS